MKNRIKMEKEISVLEDNVYKTYFDENAKQEVFVLPPIKSAEVWEHRISKDTNSYFRLPSSHWLFSSDFEIIYNWLPDFSDGKHDKVKQILISKLNWAEDDIVFFCINKSNILKTNWYFFINHWIDFLFAGDDCPIILSIHEQNILVFEPNGNLKIIHQ